MDFLQLKQPDDFLDLDFFPVVLRRPAEQAEIIAHRFGQETFLNVGVEARPSVALAHLRAVLIQNERDVRETRRLRAERAIELDVLRRIGKMILAPNDVRDFHLDVVDHVDEMKNPRAVRPPNRHVRMRSRDSSGQNRSSRRRRHRPRHVRAASGNESRRALQKDGRRLPVSQMPLVDFVALTLKIRPEISAGLRTFVPFEPEPAESVVDCLRGFGGVAGLIGILDPQDKCAAGVMREEPVEERGARATDVEDSRWAMAQNERGQRNSFFGI